MAKRFIDTELFDDPWFMDLSKDAKLLWLYLITKCNHAGLIEVNEKLCKFQTGLKSIVTTYKELGNRLVTVNKQLIFIPKFIEFQYPNFPQSKVRQQESAIKLLLKYNLFNENSLTISKELINSYEHDTVNDNVNGIKEIIKKKLAFYSDQIKNVEEKESLRDKYISLVSYLFGENAIGCPAEHILKLEKQLTFDEYKKLFSAAHSKNLTVGELMDSWVNNPKYSKDKISIYLTLNNWINRSDGKNLTPSPEKKWTKIPKTGEVLNLLEIINKMKK